MKLYSVAVIAGFMLFQQQNCNERALLKGRAGVAEEIHKTLIPSVQNYFPNAKWVETPDTRYIHVDTGVAGVTVQFLGKLQQPLYDELRIIQAKRREILGMFATGLGAFPETLSFNFNLAACSGGRPAALTYFVKTDQIQVTEPTLPHFPCVTPTVPSMPPPSVSSELPSSPASGYDPTIATPLPPISR